MRAANRIAVIVSLTIVCSARPVGAQDVCRVATLVPTDLPDDFGAAVAMQGGDIYIGAPYDNDKKGSVYVFQHGETGWTQGAKLTAADGDQDDYLGAAIAVDGDCLVAGAFYREAAYVFRLVGSVWSQEAKIVAGDPQGQEYFGRAVAVSADQIAIGAPWSDMVGDMSGAVYVFANGASGWIQEAVLVPADVTPDARFGASVSIDGDHILAGAERRTSAYVFKREGGTWVEQPGLPVGLVNDVKVEGSTALVSMDYAAYVYGHNGTEWVHDATLRPTDPLTYSMEVRSASRVGDYVIVDGWDRGEYQTWMSAAYVFQSVGDGWIQRTKLLPMFQESSLQHVPVVAAEGNHVVAGATFANSGRGAVFVYEFLGGSDCDANTIRDACDLDCNGNSIPEACDPLVDCNANGTQDSCDLYYDYSEDCNGNGVPEECDAFVDCNGNGQQDSCDLTWPNQVSTDCNENDVPDECDVAGTVGDCNHDSIPDECQPNGDCNENGVPDLCDIWTRVSQDCHGNLIPDECELADGTSTDGDGNGVPDDCECTGPMFALVPVDASGDHWISTDQNEIFVTGGQRVWLEIQACAWDPDLDGDPVVRAWQAQIDARGYGSGIAGRLDPWNPDCETDADCALLMGSGASQCGYGGYFPEGCAPGFQDFSVDPTCPGSGDIFYGCIQMELPAVSLATLDFAYGSTGLFGLVIDDGLVHYGGSLVLEVSAGAAGTFTVPFLDAGNTFLSDHGGLPLTARRPARITVAEGCCLSDGSCTGHDPQACLDLSGRPVGALCEGDCNDDGVADACELLEDCNGNGLPDSCDVQNGRSEDSNSDGVPDECEPGACCGCVPAFGCANSTLADCNATDGYFTPAADCTSVTCPTEAPSNDDCAGATSVTEGVHSFDNRCATTDGLWIEGEMCIWEPDVPLEKDVWFEYVPECDGWLYLEAAGVESDPLVAVYCNDLGACDSLPSPSREFACSQDGVVQLPVETDKCYLIRIGGDLGASGTVEVTQFCAPIDCIWYSSVEAEPGGADKNRYLSFMGGYPGRPQALRVTLADMPSPFDHLEGEIMWVGAPYGLTEVSGSNDGRPPAFWTAKLECEPHLTDWSELGVVHVTGEVVVPGATYEVDALDAYCLPSTCYVHGCWPGCFVDPLIVHTGEWGDAVGDCSVTPCHGPDGVVDFVDIMAVVDKFRNHPSAPLKARTDLCPGEPDGVIDFVDISWIVGAFRGHPYPYEGAEGCGGR